MTKQRDMTNGEHEIYSKIHHYEHPVEVEQGKIRREQANSASYRHKTQTQPKQRLSEISHTSDLDLWEDDLTLDEYELQAERELRNAKTHKQRLKRLAQRHNQLQEATED